MWQQNGEGAERGIGAYSWQPVGRGQRVDSCCFGTNTPRTEPLGSITNGQQQWCPVEYPFPSVVPKNFERLVEDAVIDAIGMMAEVTPDRAFEDERSSCRVDSAFAAAYTSRSGSSLTSMR